MKSDSLSDHPFHYQVLKDDRVFVFFQGRRVTTLTAQAAMRFLSRVEGATDMDAQLEMARVTKNFKRGNERPVDPSTGD